MSQEKDQKLGMALSVVQALKPRWFVANGESKNTESREVLSEKEQKCYNAALELVTKGMSS